MRACIVCGRASLDSRCPSHQRAKRPWVTNRPKKVYGWAWQQIRNTVKAEEPNCRYCGRPTTDIDHIIPRAEGGTDHRTNLQGLCTSCHKRKTHQEAERGRRRHA